MLWNYARAVLWLIWKERNNILFEDRKSLEDVFL